MLTFRGLAKEIKYSSEEWTVEWTNWIEVFWKEVGFWAASLMLNWTIISLTQAAVNVLAPQLKDRPTGINLTLFLSKDLLNLTP